MSKAEERLEAIKATGKDVSNYFIVKGANDGIVASLNDGVVRVVGDEDGAPTEAVDPVIKDIYANGYVKNTMLHRRWVMAQMLRGLDFRSYTGEAEGFNAWLRYHGYNYQWQVVLEEMRVQSKLAESDGKAYVKRNRFFNAATVVAMLTDYLTYLNSLADSTYGIWLPQRIRPRNSSYSYTSDEFMGRFVKPTEKIITSIAHAETTKEVYDLLKKFIDNYYIKQDRDTKMSAAFIDAYKGAGAYFTLDNLIKFHNCRVRADGVKKNKKHSLQIVDELSKEYAAQGENWRLFAFMKKVIADNKFSF